MLALSEVAAVIFDMDGVLIDSEPVYTIAYNEVMAPFGVTLDMDTKLEIMGRPPSFSVPHVVAKYRLPITAQQFVALREPILARLFASVPAISGAVELVTELKKRRTPLAVATSTFKELFRKKTAHHPWFSSFDCVVCGDDPDIAAPKPAPDIFLLAAKRLGVDVSKTAIFEDSPAGIQAARASGAVVFEVDSKQGLRHHLLNLK